MGNSASKDDVKLLEEIGRGSYAEVYRAMWRNQRVAAKKLKPDILQRPEAMRYSEDWILLRNLNHPNIVQYLTVVLPEKSSKSCDDSIIIITELLDQDLKRFIKESPSAISFRDTVNILLDVAQGLSYLQSRDIVHRDLACKNILLTIDKQAKIADFGFAKYFPDGDMAATADIGTPASRAPETFAKYYFGRRKTTYGPKADVFSFGVIMLEVIVGHPSSRISELLTEDGEVVPECYRRSEDIHEIPMEHPLHPLVLRCLENNPEDRPAATELVEEFADHKNNHALLQSEDSVCGRQIIHRLPKYKYDYEFKVVLVGDTGVGKTSIAMKFVQPNLSFQDRRPSTIYYNEFNERLQLRGKSVFLNIADTPGHFDTASLSQFYRGTHGFIVIFDVTSRYSFVNVRRWVSMIRDKCIHSVPIILVGNKTDCEVRQVDAENVRDEFDLFYIEVSAKTGVNIDETFSVLIERLMQWRDAISTLDFPPSVTEDEVYYRPSTSAIRDYKPPAKFTQKEVSFRKGIKSDSDCISLISTPEEDALRLARVSAYGSINSSPHSRNVHRKKKSCCS
ncbi:mitogen-activated protein kinase 13-like [Acropora millepora]|uniref:mitogen-activated protein kinase 13-like n=1 Tax=Acropora millepora TaxID=45264 RepID=UPI001CF5EA81|nr:mitogen-activated protein kinase 13-like [Acropora millepora]